MNKLTVYLVVATFALTREFKYLKINLFCYFLCVIRKTINSKKINKNMDLNCMC